MKNKIPFFPGWPVSNKAYPDYEYVDIWSKKIPDETDLENPYLIAHSLGGLYLLKTWNQKTDQKIILVNPSFPKRGKLEIFKRWFFQTLKSPIKKGCMIPLYQLPRAIINALVLVNYDFDSIISNFPKENLIVIRGLKDNSFCDNETAEYLKLKGVSIIDVLDAPHGWSSKYDEVIDPLVK